MSKHTPGPWSFSLNQWKGRTHVEIRPVYPAQGFSVGFKALAIVQNDKRMPDCLMENARLIAAAPELLAFAEWINRRSIDGSPESIKAREVIAKATGADQ